MAIGVLVIDFEDEKHVEDTADVLAPVEEKLIENFAKNELVEVLLELAGEDEVELVDDGESLLQKVGVL